MFEGLSFGGIESLQVEGWLPNPGTVRFFRTACSIGVCIQALQALQAPRLWPASEFRRSGPPEGATTGEGSLHRLHLASGSQRFCEPFFMLAMPYMMMAGAKEGTMTSFLPAVTALLVCLLCIQWLLPLRSRTTITITITIQLTIVTVAKSS